MSGPSNLEVADALARIAELFEMRDANPFRIRSYRRAADEVRDLRRPIAELYRARGREGLRDLPGIGRGLSGVIAEYLETGRVGLLERLEGEGSPELVFRRLPGVGPELARRIHDELGVHTLEELEGAAYDGRLSAVEGIGEKRARGIRDALAGILGRSSRRRARERVADHRPDVGLLFDVDAGYRSRAKAGKLRKIAPRRFNPDRVAWLPIMEVERDGWSFTALYSNTSRAHQLGRTDDWVVLYYERDGEHGQCTIVTARTGSLRNRRVVRGREPECTSYYAAFGGSPDGEPPNRPT